MTDERSRAVVEFSADYSDVLGDTDKLIRKLGQLNNQLTDSDVVSKKFERGLVSAANRTGVLKDIEVQRTRALAAQERQLNSSAAALRRYAKGAKDANGANIGGRFMSKELSATVDAGILKAQADKVEAINRSVEDSNRTWGAWRTELARTKNEITATNSAFNDLNGRVYSTSDYIERNRQVLSKHGKALDENTVRANRAAAANDAQLLALKSAQAAERARENAKPKAIAPVSSTVGVTPATSVFASADSRVLSTAALMQRGKEVASDYQKTLDAGARATAAGMREQAKAAAEAAREQAKLDNAWRAGHEDLRRSNSILRETATTAAIVGAALTVLAVQPARVAIAFEKEFASMKRTISGVNEDGLDALKESFVDLSTMMPVNFADLIEIGTLGGQLGIAGNQLDEFAVTVARFSSVTGISVEKSAEGLGRLAQLLKPTGQTEIAATEYEKLSSAIFEVGVSSVATEKDILSISTQISGISRFAGLATPDVIGFAGALASVGTRPELARGLVTRLFTNITSAVGGSEEKLKAFARASGMSGEQFKKAWASGGDAPGNLLIRMLNGINTAGPGALGVLNDMGLYSVRDVPAMLRLAQSTSLVNDLIHQSREAYASGKSTIDAYGNVAGTTAAKLAVLKNQFDAFLASVGSSSTGPIGFLAEQLGNLLGLFREIAGNPVAGAIAGTMLAVVGLAGVLTIAVSAIALYRVGLNAASIGLDFLKANQVGTMATTASLNAQLSSMGIISGKTATAVKLLGFAFKGLGLLALASLLPGVLGMFRDLGNNIRGVDTSNFDQMMKAISKKPEAGWGGLTTMFGEGSKKVKTDTRSIVESFAQMDEAGIRANRAFTNIFQGVSYKQGAADLKDLDDQMAALANGGSIEAARTQYQQLKNEFGEAGMSSKNFKILFEETTKALAAAAPATGEVREEFKEMGVVAQETADRLGQSADEYKAFSEAIQGGLGGFQDTTGLLKQLQEESKNFAEKTAKATSSAGDSWEDYYDGVSVDLQKYLDGMQEQIDAQNNMESNLLQLGARGADNGLIQYLAGLGPEAAPLIQALVDGTDAQMVEFANKLDQGGQWGVDNFIQNLAGGPGLIEQVAKQKGADAAKALSDGLASGKTNVDQAIYDYGLIIEDANLKMQLGIDGTKAQQELQLLVAGMSATELTAYLSANPDKANEIYAAYKATVEDGATTPIDADRAGADAAFAAWLLQVNGGATAPMGADATVAWDNYLAWLGGAESLAVAPLTSDTGKAHQNYRIFKDSAGQLIMIPVGANTGAAQDEINALVSRNASRAVTIAVDFLTRTAPPAAPGANTGGLIPSYFARGDLVGSVGFKSKGKDTVPAMLEPGEFVLRKRAVDSLGLDYLRELNAQGSAVRPAPSARSFGAEQGGTGTMMVELSPRDRQLLSRAGNVSLRIGDETIAGAAGRGSLVSNKKRTA
ncbi:tail length tape measure protein [Clavibacter phage CN1A]|uniref:Tape measure n=1 Tax=Clavibacter phage CN1A TaxID=1406793 RepID=U5PT82_9CAUD|nr:tail length tape measure protein [Clavibacter phage CN1A]AGY47150.1 tape measure [Clavibacter phage CN1A]